MKGGVGDTIAVLFAGAVVLFCFFQAIKYLRSDVTDETTADRAFRSALLWVLIGGVVVLLVDLILKWY